MSPDVALLYDDNCGFCRRAVRMVLAWDRHGRIRAVPLQAPEALELLPDMTEAQRMDSWHLVVGGRVYSAGAATGPLMRLLPAGAPGAVIAETFPRGTERAYRWIAANRERLGRFLPGAGG
ncbi:MAG TPA: DCC1-like thiol-disulfide oxidoreductase family protein [Actinomycetota bacterium]|nr:DCC1-like thiol-disulfide oxidoreductase family protein [Actinomycetota bacterium]